MSIECLICFEDINYEDRTATCSLCNQIIHTKCLKRWMKVKSSNNDVCIYCQQIDTMVYYKPPSNFQKCCNKFCKILN